MSVFMAMESWKRRIARRTQKCHLVSHAGNLSELRAPDHRQQHHRHGAGQPDEGGGQRELAVHRAPEGGATIIDHLRGRGELPAARDRSPGLSH